MIPIITLIFVIAFSMLVTKVATIALTHTGMSRERAQFQARSAFSGAGFTTQESEIVVKHPVRRRVITVLIVVGNAGLVTAISSLILGFVNQGSTLTNIETALLLFTGILMLYLAAKSKRLDNFLTPLISNVLDRFAGIRTRDFSRLMTVMEDYEIAEVDVDENGWLRGQSLGDLRLTDEGILVLGIIRNDGTYVGVPRGRYTIEKTDRIVVYGKTDRVAAISERRDPLEGKAAHKETVEKHEEELKEQDEEVESGRE